MAAAVATFKFSGQPGQHRIDQNTETVTGTVSVSADPATYTTNGIALSFASLDGVRSGSVPAKVQLWSRKSSGSAASGYLYIYHPGTTIANGLLEIDSALGTQITGAAAIPAGVSGDDIFCEAVFPRV